MSTIKGLAAVGIALFIGIQLIRPTITHPPVTTEIQAPAPVKQILRNSCYACHSNETQLSWFDQVAPAYWLVAHDVKTARAHLNFSELGALPPATQRAELYEAVNMIRLGAMPLPSYQHAHPQAIVTPEQLATLEHYLQPFAPPAPDPKATTEADEQFHQWTTSTSSTTSVQPELNGLPFFPDYKNWKPISSTDRGDNHTLREILGNDIAVKAIAEKKIQPWPDGAIFAKVAWTAVPDEQGILRAGKFLQVEFMVKDKAKYASTAGWGFGRWRGIDLKPYGKGPKFASECVGCHNPMRDNDFVYTIPVERISQ
ncbi:heme-binding domain-containing protein [Granulicella arctica]|uniref:Mono/diheme cytochrome c family protein n=1 Tax=Granulicella arctica TaxID=940613 RepID=A0A7Y9PGN2_9BACT|nr:heme-binding domain-containing protein [Granulicella arctica]NYF79549.1 mono/diheme cytochrome c family protein [Granulicella arctica]